MGAPARIVRSGWSPRVSSTRNTRGEVLVSAGQCRAVNGIGLFADHELHKPPGGTGSHHHAPARIGNGSTAIEDEEMSGGSADPTYSLHMVCGLRSWVPHGFSRGDGEFVFPTSEEMGHPSFDVSPGTTGGDGIAGECP